MAFSVTCSNCNRSFVDIDESLIGQQARCKCGAVVELDPIWNFKKSKPNKRGSNATPPAAPSKPATPSKSRKRPATAAQSTQQKEKKLTKRESPVSPRSSKPKRRSSQKQTQRPESSAAMEPSQQTSDGVPQAVAEIEAPSSFDYSDLDQILAGGIDHTPLEATRVDSPFVEPPVDKPNRRGLVGAMVGGLAGLLTAFGLLITRLNAFTGTPMGWTGNALYGTYTASLGTGEMTPAVTSMFIGIGWWLLLLAVLSGVGSVLLLYRVGTRITTGRKVLGWSRGGLATLAVVSLFTLLGLLFLETIHHGNLIHDLDSFSNSAPVEGLLQPIENVDTFQDIREKYKTESTDFMIGVLTFAVLPLICFGGVATSLLFDER